MPETETTATAVDAQVNDHSVNSEATEPSETTDKPVSAEETTETAKPGTPDKALQRMQQELGNVSRQIAALTEKKSTGELSEADKAKLEKAQQRVEKIRKFAARGEVGDGLDEVGPIAEHVLDLSEKVGKQDALESELREMKQRLAAMENDRSWQIAREKYAGLDVDAIWTKALADAQDILGDDATPRAVNRLASKTFEDRCDAAKKRQKEDAEPKGKNGKHVPAPSGYRVGTEPRTAPTLSEDEDVKAMARGLVVEI